MDRQTGQTGQRTTTGPNQVNNSLQFTITQNTQAEINPDLVSEAIANVQKTTGWRPALFRRSNFSKMDARWDLINRYPGLFEGRSYADGWTLWWNGYGPERHNNTGHACHVRRQFQPERFSTPVLKEQFADYFQNEWGCMRGLTILYNENIMWRYPEDERPIFKYRPG